MTLKNAKRRFDAIDWEVERVEGLPRKYKARPIGSAAWTAHPDLQHLLKLAERSVTQRAVQPDLL